MSGGDCEKCARQVCAFGFGGVGYNEGMRGFWKRGAAVFLSAAVWAAAGPAAALDLQLTSGDWRPVNIFIEQFAGEKTQKGKQALSEIIHDDLSASGYFRSYRRPHQSGEAVGSERYAQIRARGGEYLLTGKLQDGEGGDSGGGRLFFELHDALTEKKVGQFSIGFTADNRRLAAHKISNWIFETVARLPGVFHTKVAYVVREKGGANLLRVADYDGHNANTVLSSAEPIISPAWSPDGNELLYVSFERRRPVIYRQSLLSGERSVVAGFPGSNSAPAMSPDRRRIAAALTENKHQQQIFLLSDSGQQRLRDSGDSDSVETEPAFSPDGERVAFESDETGRPQIYETNLANGETRRLSFECGYCVSPSYAGDGARVLHIRRDNGGRYNVAILDAATGKTAVLTDIRRADSPSFSPNDAMILFKDEKFKNYLQIVAVNGIIVSQWRVRETGEIINPAWGPAQSDWF